MKFPVAKVVMPADLLGVRNGELPPSMLDTVDPVDGGKLHRTAARAFRALMVAAKADGIDLTWTPGGTYRPLTSQESLFRERYTTTKPLIPARSVFFAGQQWWLKRGVAQAATPGRSNHGWGIAVDAAEGVSPTECRALGKQAIAWLLANAASCGWSWELQSEPWHLRYVAGDRIPQRVLDIEAFLGVKP